MKMYIARTEDNELCIFSEKPFLLEIPELKRKIWVYEKDIEGYMKYRHVGEQLNPNDFPEVTFENSPQEVELKLIEK